MTYTVTVRLTFEDEDMPTPAKVEEVVEQLLENLDARVEHVEEL